VNTLGLSIGGLDLCLDISAMEARLRQPVADMFSPFLRQGAEGSQETLHVFSAKARRRGSGSGHLESLIEESLRIPLSRFPFASQEQKEMRYLLKKTLPFLHDERFRDFLGHAKGPEGVALLPFARAVLGRRRDGHESILFLKSWSRQRLKVAAIYGSVYFVSAVGLAAVGGLLMHGVGIADKGKGFLFLGLSGDGKSTVARLSMPREVVSDDGIIVSRQGGAYHLVPTPFNQYGGSPMVAAGQKVRLVAGLFLRKAKDVRVEKVPPLEACPLILRNQIHYFRYFPPEAAERTFLLAADLCREVPFYRLYFREDPTFWPLVERALAENERKEEAGHESEGKRKETQV
jgi:hypothetical protein